MSVNSLVQQIEEYIMQLLAQSHGAIRLQRNELAEVFKCVPSQISYVLNTRFTIERGYVVESQRGGGGFVRVCKLEFEHPEKTFLDMAIEVIGENLSQQKAINLLNALQEREILTTRESTILQALMHRRNLAIDLPYRDYIRARLLKAALGAIMKSGEQK